MKLPWNRKPEVRYKIVEIERPRPLSQLDPEAERSVVTLQSHPGFIYLLAKLRLQRHALEAKLKADRHSTLADVEWIQSGIFWCSWLEGQLERSVMNAKPSEQPTFPIEEAAFQEIARLTELVGTSTSSEAQSAQK